MLQYASKLLPKKFTSESSDLSPSPSTSAKHETKTKTTPGGPTSTTTTEPTVEEPEAPMLPPRPVSKAPSVTDGAPLEMTTTVSPVLKEQDEEFLQHALEATDEDPPVIIFPGNADFESNETSRSPSVAPSVNEESPAEGATQENNTWKGAALNKWDGLKRSVSSVGSGGMKKGKEMLEVVEDAAAERRRKSEEKDRLKAEEKEEKEKKKEEEKEAKRLEKEAKRSEKAKGKQPEVEREEDELTAALERLNLAAVNGRAFSISTETTALLDSFTQILKDLVNGVPTAYDDLTSLFDNSSKQLDDTLDSLPKFLQKLVKTLPEKLTKNLSPELMRTLASAAPLAGAEAQKGGAIQSLPSLKDLVTKPGLLMGLLKSVVQILKARFPMVLGVNVLYSLGLSVLLLVLYYCYKRGKEERLKKEAAEAAGVEGEAGTSAEHEAGAREAAEEENLKKTVTEGKQKEPVVVDPARDTVV